MRAKAENPLAAFANICAGFKRHLVALDPTERSFRGIPVVGSSLVAAWRRAASDAEAVAAVLHTLEGLSEREVFAAYGLDGADLQAVLDETGTPAGWFPLLAGYEAIPDLPQGLEIPSNVLAPLSREPRRTLSASELSDLKRRLRALYEAGPGAKVADDEPTAEEDDAEEESEAAVSSMAARLSRSSLSRSSSSALSSARALLVIARLRRPFYPQRAPRLWPAIRGMSRGRNRCSRI